MKHASVLTAAVAGLALAIALATAPASAQPADPRPETSPSDVQNNPDLGAHDPGRIGTMTRSNQDLNNNRNPSPIRKTATSPTTTYEIPAPSTAVEPAPAPAVEPAPPENPVVAPPAEPVAPPVLPRTASDTPVVALAGLSAVAAALALRSRRRPA